MKLILMALFSSFSLHANTLNLPLEKGTIPKLTFLGEKNWILKSARQKGDRWMLLDKKNKMEIAHFYFKLGNTEQKQLPEVQNIEIKLGPYKVNKYTVTTSFPDKNEKVTSGLITSYNYVNGELKGLVVVSQEYDKKSGLDKIIEKALASIKLK